MPITGVLKSCACQFSWWKAADAVFAEFMLVWWLEISNKIGQNGKIILCEAPALHFGRAPVSSIQELCCWVAWSSFCGGLAIAYCRSREFSVVGRWEALLMVRCPLFLCSIFVTNSLSLNFHHLKLVYFTLSFLLSAAQLVIITLYFSCWVLSFFSSLLLCDVALARNTFPSFQTKKKTCMRFRSC